MTLISATNLRHQFLAQAQQNLQQFFKNNKIAKITIIVTNKTTVTNHYLQVKQKLFARFNIVTKIIDYSQDNEIAIYRDYQKLLKNPEIQGVFIELPLRADLSAKEFFSYLPISKDVEGLGYQNLALIATKQEKQAVLASTAHACLLLMQTQISSLKAKKIALIGAGQTVGRPLLQLLLNRNATVFICDEYTKDLTNDPASNLESGTIYSGNLSNDALTEGQVALDEEFNWLFTTIR